MMCVMATLLLTTIVAQVHPSLVPVKQMMGVDDDDASAQGLLGGDDDDDDLELGVSFPARLIGDDDDTVGLSFPGRRLGGYQKEEEEDLEKVCVAINFDGIPTGTIVSSVSSGFGIEGPAISGNVAVYAVERKEDLWVDPNRAMIFNTSNPTGGDKDLETGNSLVPQQLEQMLIITEDFDSSDPDDSRVGGHVEFDFRNFGPAGVVSIKDVLIMDAEKGGTLRCYDSNGRRVKNADNVFKFQYTGSDGTLTTVDMNVEGCQRLRVFFRGSAAVELGEVCVNRPRGGGGDPIFKDSTGRRTQFWLPVGRFTRTLTVQGYELFMRVFGKPGSAQQWVDGIVIKKDGHTLFDAVLAHNNTIHARLDDASVVLDVEEGDYASTIDALKVKVNKHDFPIAPGVYGDEITVNTPGLVMRFFTMPARKFKDPVKAALYAHFDFEFLHVASQANGLLADLYFRNDVAKHATYLRRPSADEVAAIDHDARESPEEV